MDPELKKAACSGDVEFLKKAFTSQPLEYFVSHYNPPENNEDEDEDGGDADATGNIFHLSAWECHEEFFKEAMGLLPTHIKLQLLCEKDKDGWNPLHMLAWHQSDEEYLGMVKIMLEFYKTYSGPPPPPLNDDQKPWLAFFGKGSTPLHLALEKPSCINEEIAMEILSMDGMDMACAMVDDNDKSPLYYALERDCKTVAEKILMSSPSCSVAGPAGSTPLHFAPNSSETILRFLLEKHLVLMESVDEKGLNVLHKWAEIGKVWPLNFIIDGDFPAARTKVFNDLINKTTEKEKGDSPLHIAIRNKNTEFVKAVVRGYQQEVATREIHDSVVEYPFLKVKTKAGFTPLYLALNLKLEELALYILSLDSSQLHIYTNNGASPFLQAIYSGSGKVVEKILTTIQEFPFNMVCHRKDGRTAIHYLPYMKENAGRKVLEKFWWMMNLADDSGKTPLNMAKEKNAQWLVNLLEKPSLIERQPFNWIEACEKGESSAIFAFIDSCPDLQKVCRDQNDTPLHHINFQTPKDYSRLLKIPAVGELKNTIDHEGATPLHRAIRRENKLLAKALLNDDEVERNIADDRGETAMDLLSDICNKNGDWAAMCRQIKVNPHLKTNYIQPGTDLGEMRSTLSVVAALLATITFAAGFTLPGGLNQESGAAIFAKNAAFLVFLLSDAYAMCTSMFVLFCLIWSMVSTRDMAYLLVDRSVWILMQALYGTMVAFMTGVYVVISHSSLWAAIVIFVMCSLIGVATNKTILCKILEKLIPTSKQDRRDRTRTLEEGTPSISRNDHSKKTNSVEEEKLLLEENHEIHDLEKQDSLVEEATTTSSRQEKLRNEKGTSATPIHRSKSFSKEKKMIPTTDEEQIVRLPLIQEEKASTFENQEEDSKIMK